MKPINSYSGAMEYIHQRSGYDRGFISNPFAGDEAARLGLVRTSMVLDTLGNPQNSYPIVHVAGSKGKGSTSTFVDSIFRAHGLRSGRFLSPHLHRFNERIAVDGAAILDDDLANLVSHVSRAVAVVDASNPEIGRITAWELSAVMALQWFADQSCDIAVVEVGMGGTLDATNVVSPAISIVTRLDMEHQSVLGLTIEEIASNKAGIIKQNIPAITVNQPKGALRVLRQRAQDVGAPLQVAGKGWTVSGSSDDFIFDNGKMQLDHLKCTLMGDHQVENAGLAIAACLLLAERGNIPAPLEVGSIRGGLESAFLPGRFELATTTSGIRVIIDGAHSPESMRAVARTVAQQFPDVAATAVVGMLSDKDPDQVLEPLHRIVNRWIVCPINSPRSQDPTEIVASLARREIHALIAESVEEGIVIAETHSTSDGLILVIGSLSTAAEAREALPLI